MKKQLLGKRGEKSSFAGMKFSSPKSVAKRSMAKRCAANRCLATAAFWLAALILVSSPQVVAQQFSPPRVDLSATTPNQELQIRVDRLEQEVAELKAMLKELRTAQSESAFIANRFVAGSGVASGGPVLRDAAYGSGSVSTSAITSSIGSNLNGHTREPVVSLPTAALQSSSLQTAAVPASAASVAASQQATPLSSEDHKLLDALRDTTINVGLDFYYDYNFNNPVGRVNLLRAYDVLSNEFSLNQANAVIEHAPDPAAGRRWGGRLDLQFGQATDTLQGNPSNEPRPDIYRNIFQAYGTYVLPVHKGITLDFGKWSSSLGIEGNYSKDQMNYSRAFWFSFLPFYHMGLRAAIPVSDNFTVNYWIVNGTNQVEATNGFKDQLFGFTAKPQKNVTWTMNYYLGQDHPDRAVAANCGPTPVQPGLCFTAINPAPNGKTHIFDSYATWQATPKLSFAIEGDYFLERLWANAAPGESSAPSHVDGGAAYVRYQLTPKFALGTRAEYMSDRQGLFTGRDEAVKENTISFDYAVRDGLLMRYEWRRDYANQPTFLTDAQGVFSRQQNTATIGLIWWWGRKEGAW